MSILFQRTPLGVLSDEDAATIGAHFDSAPAEDKPLYAAKLNEYNAFRTAYPRPLSPEEQQAYGQERHQVERLFTDFDAATQGTQLPTVELSDNPETAKKDLANRAFLRHMMPGADPSTEERDYELRRDALAGRIFNGRGKGDDSMFHAEAKGWLERQKFNSEVGASIAEAATQAALWEDSGLPPAKRKDFAQWQEEAQKLPGYDQFAAGKYQADYAAAVHHARETFAPLKPEIDAAWRFLTPHEAKDGEPNSSDYVSLAKMLMPLSTNERQAVLGAVRQRAQMLPEAEKEGFFTRAAEGMGREAQRIAAGILTTGISEVSGPGEEPLSIAQTRHLHGIIDEVRNLRELNIAPIPENGWLEHFGMGVARSIPGMVGAAVLSPWVLTGQFQDEGFDAIRTSAMQAGTDEATAEKWAGRLSVPVGVLQAALEKATFGMAKGPLKGVQAAIAKRLVGSAVKRVAAGLTVEATEQWGQEVIQDAIPAAIQEIAHAVGAPVPEADTVDALKQTASDPATLAISVVFALGGAGHMPSVERAAEARRAGFTPEATDKLIAADTPEAMQEAWTEGLKTRTPQTSQALAEEMHSAADDQQRSFTEAGVASVQRTPEGWEVVTNDGTRTKVESADAARVLVDDLRMVKAQEEADAMVDLADSFAEGDKASGRESTQSFTGDVVKSGEGGTTAAKPGQAARVVEFDPASLKNLHEELDLLPPDQRAAGAIVLGENEFQLRERLAGDATSLVESLTTRQNVGAHVLTQVHERAESILRAGMARGTITELEARLFVNDAAQIFNPDQARNPEARAFAERVQRVAAGQGSATELRETVSELVVADVLGRRKDGGRLPAGAITRGIDEAIRRATDKKEVSALGKFRAYLRAVRGYFKALFQTAATISKARREGKIAKGDDFHQFVEKLLGMDEQRAHNEAVAKEVGGKAFSLRAYSPDRVYFHGTPERLEGALKVGLGKNAARFLHEEGIWFAPNRGVDSDSSWISDATRYSGDGGTIVSAKLKLESPYIGSVNELVADKINAKWLRYHGYDGFIDGYDGSGLVVVLDPAQVKETGRQIAKDVGADTGRAFSLGPQQDKEYMAAVESGDEAKQQEMVDEAAKAATADMDEGTRVSSRDGTIELNRMGDSVHVAGIQGSGATGGLSLLRKLTLWADANGKRLFGDARPMTPRLGARGLPQEKLIRLYSMFGFEKYGTDSVGRSPRKLPAITRDASGKVIPLSERFNPATPNITFSLASADYLERLAPQLAAKGRPPKERRAMFAKAQEQVAGMARAMRHNDENQKPTAKKEMLRALATLDSILIQFPPEVRGKVGGFTKLASLTTNLSREKYLRDRIRKLDDALEDHLREQYRDDLADLFKKAEPDRKAGEKSKGKIGFEAHRYFEAVSAAVNMTEKEVEEKQHSLEQALLKDDITPEEAADIFEKQQILDTFGALDAKTEAGDFIKPAAHLAVAMEAAEKVYETGRNKWRIQEEARLAEVKDLVEKTVAALKGASLSGSQAQKAKGLLAKAGKASYDLKSLGQILNTALGHDHPLALRWEDAAIAASNARTDATIALRSDWKAAIESATGQTGVKAQRTLWDMAHKQTVSATLRPSHTETLTVPVERVLDLSANNVTADALGLSADEALDLVTQMEAMKPGDTRKNLTVKRTVLDPTEEVKLAEAEGVFITMLARQAQYEAGMERAGWSKETIQEVEDGLSKPALQLREWMTDRYASGYKPLANVFRAMFGVDLPQIKNYAPAAFYHSGADQVTGPGESGYVPEGGFRSGFLLNRKRHAAMPRLENAFATFLGHSAQSTHWQQFAPLVREMRAVFGNPKVKLAIEAAHGAPMLAAIQARLASLEGNGIQQSHGQVDKLIGWVTSAQAYIALAWNLGSIMKQSSALFNAAYEMPFGKFMRGMGKLVTGQLDVSRMRNEPVIQRRLLGGFAPEARAVIDNAFNQKPTRRRAFLDLGMVPLGVSDALWNAASAAIAYDYHFKQATAAGLNETAAHDAAMKTTARVVSRTAQPVEEMDRSLFELRLNNFGKLAFLFVSEARQKSSLWLTAWANTLTGKPTAKDFRVLAIAHLIVAPMIQIISSLWRDWRDDDDKWDDTLGWFGFLDKQNWAPKDFLRAMALGPLNGIPVIGDLTSGFKGTGAASRFTSAWSSLMKAFEGPPTGEHDTAEWYVDRVASIMQGLSGFTGTAGRLAKTLFDVIDNAHDDDTEAGAKQLAKEADIKKSVKEAAMPAGADEAKKIKAKVIKAAEIKAAAERRGK